MSKLHLEVLFSGNRVREVGAGSGEQGGASGKWGVGRWVDRGLGLMRVLRPRNGYINWRTREALLSNAGAFLKLCVDGLMGLSSYYNTMPDSSTFWLAVLGLIACLGLSRGIHASMEAVKRRPQER